MVVHNPSKFDRSVQFRLLAPFKNSNLMTTKEFMYWLQGYFELSEQSSLTDKFFSTVVSHINLAKYADPNPDKALKLALATIESAILSRNVDAVKLCLNNVFIHVIDKSYAVDEKIANHIHGSGDSLFMRC